MHADRNDPEVERELTELDENNYVAWVTGGPGNLSTLDLRSAQHAADRAGERGDAEKLSRQIADREARGRE
jgi:hypothetical protein